MKKIQNTKYQPRIARINTDRTGLPMPAGWSLKENRSVRIRVIRGLYSVFFVSLRVISWPLNIAAGNQSVYIRAIRGLYSVFFVPLRVISWPPYIAAGNQSVLTCLPAKAGPCYPWLVFCIFRAASCHFVAT